MTTWVSWYQNGKQFWILLQQEIVEVGSSDANRNANMYVQSCSQITTTRIPTLGFKQCECSSFRPTNNVCVRALKAVILHNVCK